MKEKLFILKGDTESCDHYAWIIRSKKKPSKKTIEKFLQDECPCEYEDDGPGVYWSLEEETPVDL